MTATSARRLATALMVVPLMLTVAAIVLLVGNREVPIQPFGIRGAISLFAVVFGGTGWLMASKRSSNPIGWMLLAVGLAAGVQVLSGEYVVLSYAGHGGTLPLTAPLAWTQSWIWVIPVFVVSIFVPVLFPTGSFPSRRWRWFVPTATIAALLFAAGASTTPGQLDSAPLGLENPYANKALSDALSSIGGLLFVSFLIFSMVVLVRRFRRSTGDEHEQMKWLVFSVGVAAFALSATIVANVLRETNDSWYKATSVLVLGSFSGIAVAVAFAILTRRLYDIDVVINKTVVFGGLAVFITLVYVGVVVGVGAAIGNTHNLGLSILATAIVALSVQPIRTRANRIANRVVFGKRATPYEALSAFGDRITGSVSPADVLPELARLMGDATGVVRSSVWLVVGAALVPAASWPAADQEPIEVPPGEDLAVPGFDHVFPVRHQGELLGAIAVAESPAEPLTSAQEKLLGDLASQASLVLRNGRLIAELQASRQRLVATADQERRRIERDIHDGAQQQLVALTVKIGLVKQFMKSDAESAERMLGELRSEATEALDNLRDLARGIYPPLLADQGLAAALQGQALKSPVPVTIEARNVDRYVQEVEAAVYFCVLEALQNVSKYAGASAAQIKLETGDGFLEFSVSDNGAGFDPKTAKRGAGLTNMTDRLEALGGRLDLVSKPGEGTTINGRIPGRRVDQAGAVRAAAPASSASTVER